MKIILFLFAFILPSVEYSASFYKEDGLMNTPNIRLDGFYNTFDTSFSVNCGKRAYERYTTKDIVVFLRDNQVFYNGRMGSYSMPDFQNGYLQREGPKMIGTYRIKGDSLYATIPTQFLLHAQRYEYFSAHYVGFIKNEDTILSWKMVPPYPKIKLKFNEFFHVDTTPKMLYFVKYDKVKELEQYMK
jgi:hypothetical protein